MADGFNRPDLLQRSSFTTHKGIHQTLVIDRKVPVSNEILVLRNNLLKQCSLSHACRGASLEVKFIAKKKQGDNLGQSKKNTILPFFLFSACSKADGRCRFTRCRTGASASTFNQAFKSAINICRSTASVCVHLLPSRSGSDPEHLFRDLML